MFSQAAFASAPNDYIFPQSNISEDYKLGFKGFCHCTGHSKIIFQSMVGDVCEENGFGVMDFTD